MNGVSLSSKQKPRGSAASREGEWVHFVVRQTGVNAGRLTEKTRGALEKRYGVEIQLSDTRGVAIRGEVDAIVRAKPALDSLLDKRPGRARIETRIKGASVTSYVKAYDHDHVGYLIGANGKTLRLITRWSGVVRIIYDNSMERFEIRASSIAKCDAAEQMLHDMAVRHAKTRGSYPEKALKVPRGVTTSDEVGPARRLGSRQPRKTPDAAGAPPALLMRPTS